ncbi:helix-turn-helix transcriptional regulator [Paractinoplanes atraurantiacus]|uniref:Predicted transcriptional regulator, ArsR family n=1 Tax=Paractinoplanes atraurantiacus TaxID=1036182 RepID=A0A285KF04_9ACTN|nr:helix-turn-helix domain-containing protein [Actinoplanes atraurantiacus]SNY71209.1 Predicted transcriptional regulator, ArsR family [Actinoplanes atraurantiacus]
MESPVLRTVEETPQGLTAAQVTARVGLPLSTVRSQLDALVAEGVLVKARASGGLPHRPAWRYRALTPARANLYSVLLRALLEQVAGDRAATVGAGRRWGRAMAARGGLLPVLDMLGFSPEPRSGDRIDLHTCPYLDLVHRYPDGMCGLHAGIIQGVLGDEDGVVLEPFAAPGACVVHLPS